MSDTTPPRRTPDEYAQDVQGFIDNGDIAGLNEYLRVNIGGFYQPDLEAINAVIVAAPGNVRSRIVPRNGLEATGSTSGPTMGETDIPEVFLQNVAENLAPDEDGNIPDPMAVVATMGSDYGLTPEQIQEATSLLGPYTDAVHEATLEGPVSPDELPDAAEAWTSIQQQEQAVAAANAARTTGAAQDESRDAAIGWLTEQLTPEQIALGQWPDLPDNLTPPGLTGQTLESWINGVHQAAQAKAEDKAGTAYRAANPEASDEEVAQVVNSQFDQFGLATDVPVWMLQQFGGGATWNDPVLRQRAVDHWNDQHGTYFSDFSQVAPFLETTGPTAEMQEFVQSVMDDQEPIVTHTIRIPFVNGAQTQTVTEPEMAALRGMGFSDDAITRMVRLNALQVGKDGLTANPNADIFAMAGLTRYYSGQQDYAAFTQSQQDIAVLEQKLGLRPGDWGRMNNEKRAAMRAELVAKQRNAQASPGREGAPTPYDDEIRALDQLEAKLRGQGVAEEHGTGPGILANRNNLNRGLAMYDGDQVLGFIHAVDPGLAQRIAATGGDPNKMNGNDNAAALKIMDRGGLINRGSTFWEQLGGSIGDNVLKYVNYFDFQNRGGGGGGGGAGPVRKMLDPVAVKEQLQTKFAELMLPDIPDSVVKSVQDMLQAQLDQAPEGMNFDATARIMDWIKGRPEYGDLYGKKPEGMSEGEYQSQFQAGVQDMLGAQADPDAVKAGLRGNDYQAAVGTAAIGGLAGRNSRLLGRWALAKQTLDKFS